ncbi:MAG TPA: hypothetical protein VD993_19925 [Chitinophagaceae bacterium]|nr:hypothetical protein [Chitinophagaceae bacterium]
MAFGIAGYLFRSSQLNKLSGRIKELEKEMLQNHAEILSLQKENAELTDKLKNNSVPVIPITGGSGKENTAENLPDVTARKKLLGSSSNKS